MTLSTTEINRIITEEILKGCWHELKVIPDDEQGPYQRCLKCNLILPLFKDNIDYQASLDALMLGVEKMFPKGYSINIAKLGNHSGVYPVEVKYYYHCEISIGYDDNIYEGCSQHTPSQALAIALIDAWRSKK